MISITVRTLFKTLFLKTIFGKMEGIEGVLLKLPKIGVCGDSQKPGVVTVRTNKPWCNYKDGSPSMSHKKIQLCYNRVP